ncbi:sel1 repeat family protein [Robbsia sp. KACC 23696]|uniref:tetratricopeptide repeat protein n=1 Tax=Robbsia sp. KACC 23696 TaxID=3149231 RepID=UPI00325C0BDE
MTYRGLILISCVVLAACASNSSSSENVRICDVDCHVQPKSQVNYQPMQSASSTEEDARIAALQRAAETNPRAAYDLGLRYFRGDGIGQNSYQAIVWMRKSAEAGYLDAQKALGVFYLFGLEEMGADPREAEKWLSIAAGRGDKESANLLVQARAAKQSDEDDYKWRTQWRGVYYGYWNSGYAYRGYWRGSAWYWP